MAYCCRFHPPRLTYEEPSVPDLLLRAGRVIDPSNALDGVRDILIRDGKVHEVGENLETRDGVPVLDLAGKIVTPGWIDIHAHVYWGATQWGILPDPLCLASGVTTIVDAGSAGWANFAAMREWIIKPAKTRVLAFVHISGIGLINGLVGEMQDMRYGHIDLAVQTLQDNADIVTGVKVRQGGHQVGKNGTHPLRRAVEAAAAANTRVMVHIQAGVRLPDILELLRPGDIVTHCFQGRGDTILDDEGGFIPEVIEARKHGILFDVGHGAGSFHFPTGRRAIESGFLPDVISSDLHTASVEGPVFDMPTTASKLLNLGMDLTDVVRSVTVSAASAIGRADDLGHLRPGAAADVGIFELEEGEFVFRDTHRIEETGSQRLVPFATIRDGIVWYPEDVRAQFGAPGDCITPVCRTANKLLYRASAIK